MQDACKALVRQVKAIAARKHAAEGAGGEGLGMGNKWQQGGAFAVDDRGTVVWGGKAKSADGLMDLEAGFRALGC